MEPEIAGLMNEMIAKVEAENKPVFSIGWFPRLNANPVYRLSPKKIPKELFKKKKILSQKIFKTPLKKGILVPCDSPILEQKLLENNTNVVGRIKVLKYFKELNNELITGPIDNIQKYLGLERKCRWQFKRLMNSWLYNKYKNRLFNTEDPFTSCQVDDPLVLFNMKQRGIYIFDYLSMQRHFENSLKTNEYLFSTPKVPKNPFTNIPFSLAEQIYIIDWLRYYGFSSWIIEGYKDVKYNTKIFSMKYQSAIKIDIVKDFNRNPQLEDSQVHFADFIKCVFEHLEVDIDTAKYRILIWAALNSYQDSFIKAWRKIYTEYYMLHFQFPSVSNLDRIYDDVFEKAFQYLEKADEFRRLAELRVSISAQAT